MRVRQVTPWEQWPSGDSRPVIVLPYDLPELSRHYGLEYLEGIDDLDRYYLAAIELGDIGQAWIYKHASDPNPGTVVHVDADVDIDEAQSLLIDVFDIEHEQLLWIAPVPALAQGPHVAGGAA